jgi:hypothetical protein
MWHPERLDVLQNSSRVHAIHDRLFYTLGNEYVLDVSLTWVLTFDLGETQGEDQSKPPRSSEQAEQAHCCTVYAGTMEPLDDKQTRLYSPCNVYCAVVSNVRFQVSRQETGQQTCARRCSHSCFGTIAARCSTSVAVSGASSPTQSMYKCCLRRARSVSVDSWAGSVAENSSVCLDC